MSNGKGIIDSAKSLLGFLIAGFAAVLSFIGIKSNELASVLRNEEPFVGIVGLAFLLSIIAAILSLFAPTESAKWPSWLQNGRAIGSLLFLSALVAFLPAVIRIPYVDAGVQVISSCIVGGILIALSVACCFMSFENWGRKPFDPQIYLILASVLLMAIAGYAAIRLESASQASPFAQLEGKVTVTSENSAVLYLTVASAKVPAPDLVSITVTGLPRQRSIKSVCKGVKVEPNNFPCSADPCYYKGQYCVSLVGWSIPPNATGGVQENLVLPFSARSYRRLHIEDQLCVRKKTGQPCEKKYPSGTHLDVSVPCRM